MGNFLFSGDTERHVVVWLLDSERVSIIVFAAVIQFIVYAPGMQERRSVFRIGGTEDRGPKGRGGVGSWGGGQLAPMPTS